MLERVNYAAAALFLLSACGPPPPPPPPPFTPVGVYDLVIAAQGMTIAGTLSIEESATGYTGYIDTEMGGTGISNVMVDGTTVTFSIAEVGVDMELLFDGDEVVGGMTGAMGQAGITGTRRPGGGAGG